MTISGKCDGTRGAANNSNSRCVIRIDGCGGGGAVPEGWHAGRVSVIADLGVVAGYKGKMVRQLAIQVQTEHGTITKCVTGSLAPKSALRSFALAALGSVPAGGLDRMAGAPVYVQVEEVPKADGTTTTRVLSVAKLPAGMVAPDLDADPVVWRRGMGEIPESLPAWVRRKVEGDLGGDSTFAGGAATVPQVVEKSSHMNEEDEDELPTSAEESAWIASRNREAAR